MKKNITFLGDSITAWNPELKKYKNLGIPGFITRDIVWQLEADDENIISGDTVVLMIGVNDVMTMGYPIEKTFQNINDIINLLKKRFKEIIFISVLPIDNLKLNKEIKNINLFLKNITGVKFLDVYDLFLNSDGIIDYKFTTDGAHLSNYGYEILNKNIFSFLNSKKSEKEKMLSGELFVIADEELENDRINARNFVNLYTESFQKNHDEAKKYLKKLFGFVGENAYIIPPFKCDYGFNTSIGDNTFINNNCTLLDIGKINIGKHVLIGPYVGLYAVTHPIHPEERILGMEYGTHITIEDNVWIGGGTIINNGITIGKNSIIGSGSVVTKDIPANVIAAGNPCRVIREITENDRIMSKKDF